MALIRATAVLDAEQAKLEALLAATNPAPTPHAVYDYNLTLDVISSMRMATGESESDYKLRLNGVIQQAPSGFWSTSFWSALGAAIAADTAVGPRGGLGRGDA